MALTLARDELTDAELVELIGRGDPRAAARFWVRHWPTALTAARGLVDPVEVPGLAAEALIGTLAAVRVGTGPRSNAAVFVIDAVHELGGDLSMQHLGDVAYPDVFPSATLAAAFGDLPVEDQQLLWAALADGLTDDDLAAALGISTAEAAAEREDVLAGLQESYLRRHAEVAQLSDCVETHGRLAEVVADSGSSLPRETWVHVSDCVICTEAFHELAHSSVDLGPLLGAAAYPGPLPAAPVAMPPVVAAPVLAEPIEPVVAADLAPIAVFEPAPEPVAVAKAAILPELDAPPQEEGRRRRPFALLLGAAVLAAVVALAANLVGGTDTTAPSAASTGSSGSPYVAPTLPSFADGTPTPGASATPSENPSENPTLSPTGVAAAAPSADATVAAEETDEPAPTTGPTKIPAPTKTASPEDPGPTAEPSDPDPPATEEPTPAPTPTATPTPRCNLVQKLLGMC